jgi:hypothetical protein
MSSSSIKSAETPHTNLCFFKQLGVIRSTPCRNTSHEFVFLQTTRSHPFYTSPPSVQTTTSRSRVHLTGFVFLSLSFSIFMLSRRQAAPVRSTPCKQPPERGLYGAGSPFMPPHRQRFPYAWPYTLSGARRPSSGSAVALPRRCRSTVCTKVGCTALCCQARPQCQRRTPRSSRIRVRRLGKDGACCPNILDSAMAITSPRSRRTSWHEHRASPRALSGLTTQRRPLRSSTAARLILPTSTSSWQRRIHEATSGPASSTTRMVMTA